MTTTQRAVQHQAQAAELQAYAVVSAAWIHFHQLRAQAHAAVKPEVADWAAVAAAKAHAMKLAQEFKAQFKAVAV